MKKIAMTISQAKEKVLSLQGKDVRIIVNKGRKKIEKWHSSAEQRNGEKKNSRES